MKALYGLGESVDKFYTIFIAKVDNLTGVAAFGDLKDGAGVFNVSGTGHKSGMTRKKDFLRPLGLTRALQTPGSGALLAAPRWGRPACGYKRLLWGHLASIIEKILISRTLYIV